MSEQIRTNRDGRNGYDIGYGKAPQAQPISSRPVRQPGRTPQRPTQSQDRR